MYNKDFFQKHFALTPAQAEDYTKAFHRICYLLQDYDPLHKHRRSFFYYYEKEAFLVLQQMPVNLKQAEHQLKKVGFAFTNAPCEELEGAARKLLSIADCFIWPAFVYNDWIETSAPDSKEAYPPLLSKKAHKTSKQKKAK